VSNRTYLRVEKTLKDVGYIFRCFVRVVAVWRIVDGESLWPDTVERKDKARFTSCMNSSAV
jgi:hypothetical protein